MDAQTIIDKALFDTRTPTWEINNDDLVRELNVQRDYIVETVKNKLSENFFYDEYETDFFANQNEYNNLETILANKVLGINVKFSDTDEKRVKATYIDPLDFFASIDDFSNNTSKQSPFYTVKEQSFFIYPTPDKDVINGLRFYALVRLPELTISSTEADIWGERIQGQFDILSLSLEESIYKNQQDFNKANIARQNFQNRLDDMLNQLSWRVKTVQYYIEPDISYLSN